MDEYIAVQIENDTLVRLMQKKDGATGVLELTTKEHTQERARLKIYQTINQQAEILTEVLVEDLPRQKDGKPGIRIRGEIFGTSLLITVVLNDILYYQREIPLETHKRPTLLPIFLAIVGAIALLVIVFLFTIENRSGDTQENPISAPVAAPESVKQETPPTAEEVIPPPQPVILPFTGLVLYFEPNRSFLTEETKAALLELVAVHNAEELPKLTITGHCALAGTERGRMDLSRDRARGVYQFLLAEGWLPNQAPQIEWKGGLEPVSLLSDMQHVNRRVEISLASK